MARVPASESTRKRLQAMMNGTEQLELSKFVRESVRLLVEEALEAEVAESLGRGYYEHAQGEQQERGHRNGYRLGGIKSAEGELEFGVPQVRGGLEPWRSQVREALSGRTEEL